MRYAVPFLDSRLSGKVFHSGVDNRVTAPIQAPQRVDIFVHQASLEIAVDRRVLRRRGETSELIMLRNPRIRVFASWNLHKVMMMHMLLYIPYQG